jgi:hypothetical protein
MWKVFNLVNQEKKDVHQLEVHTFLNALFIVLLPHSVSSFTADTNLMSNSNVQHIKAQNNFYCIW